MRRKASSIRATSSVSPTPSIESGSGPGVLRSTFSISSISVSSGAQPTQHGDELEGERGHDDGENDDDQGRHRATIGVATYSRRRRSGRYF